MPDLLGAAFRACKSISGGPHGGIRGPRVTRSRSKMPEIASRRRQPPPRRPKMPPIPLPRSPQFKDSPLVMT
eukprot:3655650-Pyramimonas_sp.AAC.1